METAQSNTEEVKFPAAGEVKMSKVEKFFHSQKEKFESIMAGREKQVAEKVNKFITSHEGVLSTFINGANTKLQEMDKKFSNMYGILVRQFLTNLENRVYTNELSHKALLLLVGEKLWAVEPKVEGETAEQLEARKQAFFQALELELVQKMTETHNANEKALAEEANKAEVKNEEVPQEAVAATVPEEVPAATAQQ